MTSPRSGPGAAKSATRVYSFGELASAFQSPDGREHFSPLLGPGFLALDLDGPRAAESDARRFREELPTLPCVTIGVGRSRVDDWSDGFDVLVEDPAALDALVAGFASTPLAALAFVQLLRNRPLRPPGQSLSLEAVSRGLVAESFVYSTLQAGPEFRQWKNQRKRSFFSWPGKRRAEGEGPACRMDWQADRIELVLDRPKKHNAFSRAMRDSLCEALQAAGIDPRRPEILIRGEGPSFCSGGDLDEFGSFPDATLAHVTRTTRSPALAMAQLSDRVRCEVHGACLGAGVELPGFARSVVATEDAFFGLPELSLGLIPGAGGTVSLPHRIGRQRTAWLGLSGARIDAQTALDWGLVDEVRLAHHPDGTIHRD